MIIGLHGDGDQQGVADKLLAQGHTVVMHVRWPREVWEIRRMGGEVWRVGDGGLTVSHEDLTWGLEPDRVV